MRPEALRSTEDAGLSTQFSHSLTTALSLCLQRTQACTFLSDFASTDTGL